MRELRLFVGAVGSHWGMLLTGSVVSVAGLLHAQYGSDPIPNWIFWGIAGVCLVIACFLAWRDEHRARVKAENHTPSLDYQAAAQEQILRLETELQELASHVPVQPISEHKTEKD
jgi:hypothetical protein